MITAALPNGICYKIPRTDMAFFEKLAKRMQWTVIVPDDKSAATESTSWVDEFSAKWKDSRTAEQIVADIHAARTTNAEIEL